MAFPNIPADLTQATLSPGSLYHLRALETPAQPLSPLTTTPADQGDTSAEPSASVNKPSELIEFTFFPKLPPEIREEIWNLFVLQTPRIVRLSPKWDALGTLQGNPSVTLRQICEETRKLAIPHQPLKDHGYRLLRTARSELSSARRSQECNLMLHPEIDMLYIPNRHLSDALARQEARLLHQSLVKYNLSSSLRCIAIDWDGDGLSGKCLLPLLSYFATYPSLELVYIVMANRFQLGPLPSDGDNQMLRFEESDQQSTVSFNWGWYDIPGFERKLQELLRGRQRGTVPLVRAVTGVWMA